MNEYLYWKKWNSAGLKNRVFEALKENVSFFDAPILGVPASHLDSRVFYQDAPFLKDAPFISTLIQNPNHIGCHTTGSSEHFFKGTQALEREVIDLCATDILGAGPESCDGYVASGGTEANMQAVWIYRNYFQGEYQAALQDIALVCSEDAHYSMAKAANILSLPFYTVPVNETTRQWTRESLEYVFDQAQSEGRQYFILVANMMTTMFGSVDDIEVLSEVIRAKNLKFCLHVDGAYGGFFYPFSNKEHQLNFTNPLVTSVTLDAHKMVQAPYGTGVFIIRKGWMQWANTREASYVEGEDTTLIGSRSGANAVAIWMILSTYGPYGWKEKILILLHRAEWMAAQLRLKEMEFYREQFSNIITIRASHIPHELAEKYALVPDNHRKPEWYKIVVMEHVNIEKLMALLEEL